MIQDGKLYVFTTRADTIMGVTFCAVAPEHPLATQAALSNPQLAAFIEQCKLGGTTEAEMATREKEGMPTGLYVTHPVTGAEVQVWVGNYVLMTYGDGAVMGVPAHDERDFAFAKKYDLPIVQVVDVAGKEYSTNAWQEWYGDKQAGRTINSGKYDGLSHKEAVDAIAVDLGAQGWAKSRPPGACATGASRASAIGAPPSPSSTARIAARSRCRKKTCRWSCPTTSSRTAAATRWPRTRLSCPAPAPNAASRRA